MFLGEAGGSLATHLLPRNYPSFGISSLDMTTGPKPPGGDELASQLRSPESHPSYFLRKPCLKALLGNSLRLLCMHSKAGPLPSAQGRSARHLLQIPAQGCGLGFSNLPWLIFAPKDPPAFGENESRSLLAKRGSQGWEAEGFL